jgi:tRNA modification GTPase
MVIDGSQPITDDDQAIASQIGNRAALLVVNKSDLGIQAKAGKLGIHYSVQVSALTGDGLALLEENLSDLILGGEVLSPSTPLLSNSRHEDALKRALAHLRDATNAREAQMAADFVSIDLRAALSALGEITGEIVNDDLLENIFGNFCIGK